MLKVVVSLNSLTAGTASARIVPSISVRPREVRTVFKEICFLGADVGFDFFFFGRSRDVGLEDLQKKLVSIEIFQLFRYIDEKDPHLHRVVVVLDMKDGTDQFTGQFIFSHTFQSVQF